MPSTDEETNTALPPPDMAPPTETKPPVIKPDHVSLGQCVVHQEFSRKYSSVKDIDIVNLLHDGCIYNGFKDLLIQSSEEEGFANMHHILKLSSQDKLITKELCVQRGNNITVEVEKAKTSSHVLTDINTVVIITPYTREALHLYFFCKDNNTSFTLDDYSEDFKAMLMSDILTLDFSSHLLVINFRNETPSVKRIDTKGDNMVLSTCVEMLVTFNQADEIPQLHCEYLHEEGGNKSLCALVPCLETLNEMVDSKMITLAADGVIYFLVVNDEKISLYLINQHNTLVLHHSTEVDTFFPNVDCITFVDMSYCNTTMQCFLLYLKEDNEEVSSFILVFDLNKFKVGSILEMEMTLNRTPDLGMYPLRDGSRLFVQEIFEHRTIFYQAFTLLPVKHLMETLKV